MKRMALLLVIFLAACSPVRPRGDIGFIAPDPVSVSMARLSDEPVKATVCFPDKRVDVFSNEPIVQQAMNAALAKAPGATALADMVIEDDTGCTTVSGYPVKLEQGTQKSAIKNGQPQ